MTKSGARFERAALLYGFPLVRPRQCKSRALERWNIASVRVEMM
jgi:hypothetical protein